MHLEVTHIKQRFACNQCVCHLLLLKSCAFLRCVRGMASCRLKSCELVRQSFLPPPRGIGLFFFVGHVYPAGFAVGQIASDRIKSRHGTTDAASKETTGHERTSARRPQEIWWGTFDGL